MITCLAALIFLAIIIHIISIVYDDTESIPFTIIFTAVISGTIALLGGAILTLSAMLFIAPTEETYIETKPIYALQETSGGIFYTSGYMDSELSYFYLTSTDFGLKSEHIPADTTYIKTSDNPRLEITYTNYEFSWIGKILFFPLDANYTAFQDYTLYIPEDSITNSILINLEN